MAATEFVTPVEPRVKITYFVHDVGDPAVHRRLRMLRAGGAEVTLIGFSRTAQPATNIEGVVPVLLGRTRDARLGQRILAVLRAALRREDTRKAVAGADIVIARQLEMLVLASTARRRFAPSSRLVYECLDIHRMMVSTGLPGTLLRALEQRLLNACTLLLVSSPAFVTEYFARVHGHLPPVRVEENKVLEWEIGEPSDVERCRSHIRPPGPPWRIGWFGVIRCRRSLAILQDLARRFPGRIEVVIRGRPARNVIPEFDRIVADTPGLSFLGAYDRGKDLARIYHDVHFAWTIDFYEAGGNSDWLLPNRLYEGCLMGSVPLAVAGVQTGHWLRDHGIGPLLTTPLEASVPAFFDTLDQRRYAQASAAVAKIQLDALVGDSAACTALVEAMARHLG